MQFTAAGGKLSYKEEKKVLTLFVCRRGGMFVTCNDRANDENRRGNRSQNLFDQSPDQTAVWSLIA